MCFKAFQCTLPRLCVKQAKRLTEKDKSSCVATCIYIAIPKLLSREFSSFLQLWMGLLDSLQWIRTVHVKVVW